MTRVYAQKLLVALLVAAFAASPFAGAVCTMSCADSNGACCCTSAGIPGELSYEKPSCCGPEVSVSAEGKGDTERLAGNGRTVLTALLLSPGGGGTGTIAAAEGASGPQCAEPGTSRSSPVFLLNSVFLI